MTKIYAFVIKGVGKGGTLEDAWEDCKEALQIDDLEVGGVEYELTGEDEEDEDEDEE